MNVFNFPAKWDFSILHPYEVSDFIGKFFNVIALLEFVINAPVEKGSINITFV